MSLILVPASKHDDDEAIEIINWHLDVIQSLEDQLDGRHRVSCSVMSESQSRFTLGAVNSRLTRSLCTGGPALRFRPRFFDCSNQSRC